MSDSRRKLPDGFKFLGLGQLPFQQFMLCDVGAQDDMPRKRGVLSVIGLIVRSRRPSSPFARVNLTALSVNAWHSEEHVRMALSIFSLPTESGI